MLSPAICDGRNIKLPSLVVYLSMRKTAIWFWLRFKAFNDNYENTYKEVENIPSKSVCICKAGCDQTQLFQRQGKPALLYLYYSERNWTQDFVTLQIANTKWMSDRWRDSRLETNDIPIHQFLDSLWRKDKDLNVKVD